MLTRITVNVTGILLVLGTLVILSSESANPETLGKHDAGGKLLRAFFASVNARTAGFTVLVRRFMVRSAASSVCAATFFHE